MNVLCCHVSYNHLPRSASIEIAVKATEKQRNLFVISLESREEAGSDSGDL